MTTKSRPRKRAPLADPKAREHLRKADPVLARLIDERPDLRPRAWTEELPPFDAFGTLVFQVAGQQLSVASTRAIIRHLEDRFGGLMPSAAELLAADPQVLRDAGFSGRKGQTLRDLAERPDFRPRAWTEELPPFDAFGTLVFQVAGQQLSVASTRAIIRHLEDRFGGLMPSAAELLAADPQVLRDAGFSTRKGQTLRDLAERFVDGRLSDEALARMSDEEVEAALTEVPGIGLWTARGFLLVALDRPDVFLSGDLALRRAIERAYGFDHLPTEDEVARISDRWRPYRSLAVSYLFASEYDA